MSTKPASIRALDPQLEEEKKKYAHPVPSRALILRLLTEEGVPMPLDRLAARLDIKPHEREGFERRLAAMERDGQIIRNRKNAICVAGKLGLIKGTVEGHPDGYGFVIPDEGGGDLFLSPREMRKVLHGDRVMVREAGVDRRGRREATVVEVLERANREVVARLHVERGVRYAVPEDRRISQDILIPEGDDLGARPGQIVVVEILEQPSEYTQPIGRVVEVLGHALDPGIEIEIAVRKYHLPHVFPPEVEEATKGFPPDVERRELRGRKDLRSLPLVTIDGETARDFDDAVYCRREGKGFRLWVAIADVSHYVRHGDPLDLEARKRGNSVYFPRRVIPMLPEVLSNHLCSLNPRVDRLCVACEMQVDARGEIAEYAFYPAVMHSHGRLTYTAAAAALADPGGEEARALEPLLPHLQDLHRLYKVLAAARLRRGAIDFETIETRIVFNEEGRIERIVPEQRNDAHRLIEECMLAANVCASDFLDRHGHPMLYRVHEGPTPEKLEALRDFLREFGLSLGGGDAPTAKDYARLLQKIHGRPDAGLLQTVMLRSLQQAVYSPKNAGHFGLAYERYTHFTSPIRRYADLLIHRAIKAALKGRRYSPGNWEEIGRHVSFTERRADEATRDVENWLKCYYMKDRVGEVFEGTVSAVTSFGLFVSLDNVYVEGLVHISELGNDYFQYDPARHQLLGERTGRRFRLADRVRVRVAQVDLETSRIDFVLAEDVPEQRRRREPARRGRRT
ncbi:ribonuclease R [Pelomicrobium sp. G1]|uniref:ribonuclease R n=1 Tax=unclassified Pelomicrobium TaxID=2815318 RepID=UPI003F778014